MEQLTEVLDKLYAENKGAEAEALLKRTLQEAYDNGDFMGAVPVLNELIGYCRETGQVERSYAYADKVQEILQKLGLEGSLPHATTLLNIANAYRAGGKLEDSLQYYEKVAVVYRQLLEAEDMLWANFYNNLSLLYQELGRFDLAKECLLKALQIVMQKKDTIFEQAVTYTNLANTCLQLGQADEAEKYFMGAILLFEKHNIQDAHYCAALSAMATYLYQKKEYVQAEKYFCKAMEGIERSLGRNEFYERMLANAKLCQELAQLGSRTSSVQGTATEVSAAMEGVQGAITKQNQTMKTSEVTTKERQSEVAYSGLELCKAYYEEVCKPMLQEKFPDYVNRIAVGLVGEGSDCFGYDDAYSRDHDWGPRLFLWVNDDVYEEIGTQLEGAYSQLSKEFRGFAYKETELAGNRQGVWRIKDFYKYLLDVGESGDSRWTDEPSGAEWCEAFIKWEDIPMERLAAAVNGEIFAEGSGEFTQIREFLKKRYPEALWYLKIAEAAAGFSQAGQYNYQRMLKRGDGVTAQMMLGEAVKEAMKLLYYRDKEYPPHDKWLLRGLQKKEVYAEVLSLIQKVMTGEGTRDKSEWMEQLGEQLAHLLYQADIISDVDGFLQEHVNELLFKASVAMLSVEELAEKITQAEFKAFDKVKNSGGRADCQDDWFTFSIMRKSQYYTWNATMLMQYLYDFTREYAKGHNLIEEKYGRMMESTAPAEYEKLKAHFPTLTWQKKQIVEEIVKVQVSWMEDFGVRFPKLAGNARSIHTYEDHLFNTSYETYLRGEISTYSDKMLELYGRYIVEYMRAGNNVAQDIMKHSVLLYGYRDLQDAEARME